VRSGADTFGGNFGGGVFLFECSAILEDCRFLRNSANGGAGVWVGNASDATVSRCIFSGNTAPGGPNGGGGAMGVRWSSRADVDDSVFTGNSGAGDGGALGVWSDSDLTVRNSTIVGNKAYLQYGHAYGGVICGFAARATFSNCVVHANIGVEGNAFSLLEPRDE